MNAQINVLHVSTGMGEGGAEAMLARLIQNTRIASVKHHVLALSHEGPLWGPTSAACASSLNLNLDRRLSSLPRLAQLGNFVRSTRANVIHGWMYHGNLAASWCRRSFAQSSALIFGIRQSLYDLQQERFLTRAVIRKGAVYSRAADVIVYNSGVSQAQHTAIGYAGGTSRVIANGFETNRFRPDAGIRTATRARFSIDDSEFVIGIVARFHPVKDHAMLLRAVATVTREHRGVRVLIAGPGCSPDNSELRKQIKRYGGGARIELLGAWRETESLYPALDALCLTSKAEGFPNVVGEAMSCGVVCFCTAVGEVPRIIGDTGFLSAVGDSGSLASQLLAFARLDWPGRLEASKRARSRIVECFPIESIVDEYVHLYVSLAEISERRSRT